MFPNFNSFPKFPNQIQPNPTNTPNPNPLLHQDVSSNPNSMQIQPQMGMFPQTPGTNSNIPMSGVLNPGFMNGPNNLLNFPLGMQQLGQLASLLCNLGQNSYPINSFQQNPQLFQQNLLQQFGNTNAGLPNFNFALQNLNQLLPGPPVFNQYNGVPNPLLLGNSQVGMLQQMNQTQHNLVQQAMGAAGGISQRPGESSVTPVIQHQSNGHEGSLKFGNMQENFRNKERITTPNPHFKNFQKKGFQKASRGDASQMRSRKPHFQQKNNGKRKFEFNNGHKGREAKGNDQPKECKRSLAITYTKQEIQKWCEARRKNHPFRPNIRKESGTNDTDIRLRREQLKEILAKQAELGVEVAEIPSCYLSDSKNKVQVKEQNKRPFNRRERFQNWINKRGRHDTRERFNKKQRSEDAAASNVPPLTKNKATLLQKLLSKDIKRDKCHLLQAFRFMVMNSFFKHTPDQPLKFPTVVVKNTGDDDEVIEDKYTRDVLGGSSSSKNQIESIDGCDNDKDSDHEDGENFSPDNVYTGTDQQYCQVGMISCAGKDNGGPQLEEGEIID